MNDIGEDGEDLSGGYFDAGDFMKFGLPMAFSITTLGSGLTRTVWQNCILASDKNRHKCVIFFFKSLITCSL